MEFLNAKKECDQGDIFYIYIYIFTHYFYWKMTETIDEL